MRAVVSEKGQVTVPKALRDRLGLRPGTVLEFDDEDGRLVARKSVARSPVDGVFGRFADGFDWASTDEFIDEIRGEADAIDPRP